MRRQQTRCAWLAFAVVAVAENPRLSQPARRLQSIWLIGLWLPQPTSAFGSLFSQFFNSSKRCRPDSDSACAQWAKDGECEKNQPYMHDACATSCGLCLPPSSAAAAQQQQQRRRWRGCQDDEDYACSARAARGECDSNKGEMLMRCQQSCHVCPWSSLLQEALGCDDAHANCAEWARHGECQAKYAAHDASSHTCLAHALGRMCHAVNPRA